MVALTCFGTTLPSSGSVPSAFWEMLNWGVVDRILWIGVLYLLTWCTHHVNRHNTPTHNILSTAPQLSICQKALGRLPEDGNVMLKHVGATIHNRRHTSCQHLIICKIHSAILSLIWRLSPNILINTLYQHFVSTAFSPHISTPIDCRCKKSMAVMNDAFR
jgi:hypothetical protein